jgi:molybdopterin-containing oxidoreductase family molybdopterin binding subunit
MAGSSAIEPKEGGWVPTVCYGCYNACGIKANVVNGVVVDIVGDPDNPGSLGHICAKGKARIQDLYDPARVRSPMRRRNPKKGIGVDPQWEPISWEDALDVLTAKLSAIKNSDPRKLVIAHFDLVAAPAVRAFATAFGTPHSNWSAAGLFCGMGSHAINMLINGAYNSEIDFEHCKHAVLVGTQMGFMVDSNAQATTHGMARARARGMKLTVIDPVCGTAASKADKWIPLIPGTDGAFGLGIVNVLLNELAMYDAPFLRKRTNAAYLVGPGGHYVRDENTGVPLVWDEETRRAVPFHQVNSERMALEGTFTVNSVEARPAFTLLREHVAHYTPELVESITDVPVSKLRKLARELAEDACLGSTINIGGKELPYRPVAVNFKMGAVGHKHGMATAFALHLINIVLGAIDVPGSFLGVNPIGPTWVPEVGRDGMLVAAEQVRSLFGYNSPFPGASVRPPESLSLQELFPVAVGGRVMYPFTILDPAAFGLDFTPALLIHCRVNLMASTVEPTKIGEALARIPFIASFATHVDETVEFADLVLPDAHDMERYDLFPANHPYAFLVPGPGVWYGARRQPVIKAAGEARHWGDVLFDLAYRMQFGDELNQVFNVLFKFEGVAAIRPDEKVHIADIADRQVFAYAGEAASEVGRVNGSSTHRLRQKRVDEAYPGPWVEPRFPIYMEHLLALGEQVKQALAGRPVHWDVSDYVPLPGWKPSAAHEEDSEQYDLFGITYKLPFHALGLSSQNPWLTDLAERHPYAFRLLIHPRTAAVRNIRAEDKVTITSRVGSVTGEVCLTEGIHPKVVAIAGIAGHWAKGLPVARGRGIHFNTLAPLDLNNVDKLSSAFDSKVKVRVEPLRAGAER